MPGTSTKTSRRTPEPPRARTTAVPGAPARTDVSGLQQRLGNRGVSMALSLRPPAPSTEQDGDKPTEVTLSATDTRDNAGKATEEKTADDPARTIRKARGRESGAPEAVPEVVSSSPELSQEALRSVEPDTGAGDLATGDLILIDVELAEHQRWAGARGRVGDVASLQRAQFVVQAAGGGFVNGVATGAAMGLGMGVLTRYVPALGPILGAKLALHGLMSNEDETRATIARFAEGSDTYEVLANSIAAAAAIIDTVSQTLTVINGIVGIVEIAAAVVAGGATILAFFTFGATLGVAVIAGDVVLACHEISAGINAATSILDTINARILQPAIMLFRALHAFTTQGDPREVELQGQGIAQAAGAAGAALGAAAGGELAHAATKPKPPADDLPPFQKPSHETPPPAPGEGPEVHFHEPATAKAEPTAPIDQPGPAAPVAPMASSPASSPVESALTAPPAVESPPAAEPVQLALPHTEDPGSQLKAMTAPLQLEAINGSDLVPQGLEPGSIGTYARGVDNPHPAASLSNPAGAPGATAGGGRMPSKGRKSGGVYLEHQTSAAVANEVLTGHEYTKLGGRERSGADVKDALTIALPESVKSLKDTKDKALLSEVRDRKAAGEQVPPIEVITRSAKFTQDAIAQAGAEVPGSQVSRNFLAEVDQFNDPRFGYQEVLPGDPLPEGHPLASSNQAGIDAFLDRTFDPFITSPQPSGGPSSSPSTLAAPTGGSSQMSLDFGPLALVTPTPPPTPAVPTPAPPSPAPPSPAPSGPRAGPPGAPGPQAAGAPSQSPGSFSLGSHAEQAVGYLLPAFFGGGEGPSYAERQAAHRARFTADNQPAEGVERVDPNYPPPPATPAQITAIQNQILNLLKVKAAAEQESRTEAERAAVCEQNQSTIELTVADTRAGISAVKAHDEAVARRAAVNQEQQQREQETQGLVAGYPSQAAGLEILTVPLAAWAGFTSLASHLPGSAGDSMLRMNMEAMAMLQAFGQMTLQMAGVESSGPGNQEQLQYDKGRLADTAKAADRSDARLKTAYTGAQNVRRANEAAHAEASKRQETADVRAQQCSDAATSREAQAERLAQQLRIWATRHAEARQKAVAATTKRLQKEGRIIVPGSRT